MRQRKAEGEFTAIIEESREVASEAKQQEVEHIISKAREESAKTIAKAKQSSKEERIDFLFLPFKSRIIFFLSR